MKKSNLYLLRIIAMQMILVLHYNMERGGGLFNNPQASDLLPLHCIACSFTIYFICVIIGTVRKFIYKYIFDKINDKIKIFNKEVEF